MRLEDTKKTFDYLFTEMRKVIVGQDEMIKQMIVALMANSHALLEGYPGLAKTLTVKTMSQLLDLKFSRVQNTPDLMPSDITGTYIIEETGSGKRTFKFQPGPVFANILLADEINRATPKTQSALLEAMQEKQVTVGNSTYKLEEPFFVLATQNPIEQEGSLALNETVFINGQLKTGKELIKTIQDTTPVAEDEKGIKLYNINSWTFSLNTSGKLEKQKCSLYTLPYNDKILQITTKTGKKLRVTKNHPFLVNENGVICWKKAEELTKQDYLINPARLPDIKAKQVISHQEALEKMIQKPINNIPFDKDFAFWIALLLSDGYIGKKCIAAVQKNYPEVLDHFVTISKKYGFNPSLSTNLNCRYARIYSESLVEYLLVRFGVQRGKDKEIPSWFLSFTPEMNREFLKTFISLKSSLKDNKIILKQKSEKNVNMISFMLLREGILSWPKHDGKIFTLKIQGKDYINFIQKIGLVSQQKITNIDLTKIIKSSFKVVPIKREVILRLVEILELNNSHTLKNHQHITSKTWYNSYKSIKEGEIVMSVDSLKELVNDIKSEITNRKINKLTSLANNNSHEFTTNIRMPVTEIASTLNISKNQVLNLYNTSTSTSQTQIKLLLKDKYTLCIKEAKTLLKYCEALLSKDIYYDQIKTIQYTPSEGLAFGLTVSGPQNYLAGFGGCGINHNTYPLPEAQSDRFLLKIKTDYPSFDDEIEIVNRYAEELKKVSLKPILSKESLLYLQTITRQVPIATDIKKYAVTIVTSTRNKKDLIEYGASPRASIGLILAAKARALIEGRKFVSKEDINKMAFPILRHRIILSFEAERQNLNEDDVIKQMLK